MPFRTGSALVTSSSQLGTGVVTSDAILNGTILNADLNSAVATGNAVITSTFPYRLVQASATVVAFTDAETTILNASVPASTTGAMFLLFGAVLIALDSANAATLRWRAVQGANNIVLQAPATSATTEQRAFIWTAQMVRNFVSGAGFVSHSQYSHQDATLTGGFAQSAVVDPTAAWTLRFTAQAAAAQTGTVTRVVTEAWGT